MKTRLITGIVVVIFVIILGVVFVNIASNNLQLPFFNSSPKATVLIDGHTFHVKVASTEKDKEIGLSTTSSLPKDQGMFFPFTKAGYYAFWMKNMKFPIDIIYIKDKKIVTIFSHVSIPNTMTNIPIYKPTQPADAVLEINADLANQYHFSIGDSVTTSL